MKTTQFIIFSSSSPPSLAYQPKVNSETDSCRLKSQSAECPICPLIQLPSTAFLLGCSQLHPQILTDLINIGPVLSTPAVNSFIAMGFSSNGQMVGSSAIVGWVSSTERTIKQYSWVGLQHTFVEPNKGNLQVLATSL
ncbi:unnamed protein product [Prunus armeniaca]|uniref:Uncharacterized protein n=1 Tax=Prunus armeniaca TaxID=36596 RepID=A0A6J5Y5L1_PRUAR|nr:unnamed protein product [Prunus armeniaca]